MNFYKALFAALFCCVLTSSIFAQSEFKDGFIVDASNNYTYGYLSFTETPHLTCLFKEQKDGTAVTYTTGQIEAYGIVNGNHFRKRPFEDLDDNSVSGEIFMEAVADGPITLYVAFDRMFVERATSFYELKIEKEKEKQETYRQTLMSLMADCAKVVKRAKSVAITIPSVKALVSAYNQCAGAGDQVTPTFNAKSTSELGLFTGIDRTQFSMTGKSATGLENKKFTDRTLVSGGFHFKLVPKSKYISFVTGLWFNDQRLYASGKANGNSRVQTARLNYQLLRLPVLLEAGNFTASRVQPYVKAGVSVPIMLKSSMTIDEENQSSNVIYIDQHKAGEDFKEPLLLHMMGGVSLPIKNRLHVFCEVYYSKGKRKFMLDPPDEVTGNFSSKGFNVGLVIRWF